MRTDHAIALHHTLTNLGINLKCVRSTFTDNQPIIDELNDPDEIIKESELKKMDEVVSFLTAVSKRLEGKIITER